MFVFISVVSRPGLIFTFGWFCIYHCGTEVASRPPPVQFKVRFFFRCFFTGHLIPFAPLHTEHCGTGSTDRKRWPVPLLWLEKHKLKHTEKNIKVILQSERQQSKGLFTHPNYFCLEDFLIVLWLHKIDFVTAVHLNVQYNVEP